MISRFLFTAALTTALSVSAFSQEATDTPTTPGATPTPPTIVVRLPDPAPRVSVERRAAAYKKLLEGQRYIWHARQVDSSVAKRNAARMARDALRKAVELNPRLAEGYTALAELSLRGADSNIEEAISLANIAVRIDPDNFGGHIFLGRLFTVKSKLGRGGLESNFAAKAVEAWREVGRLDPKNAEAWAFLSIFYKELKEPEKRIEALRNWLASANTPDSGFYLTVVRGNKGLSPENAAVELGEALLESGAEREALLILSRAVSDNPSDLQAVDLMGRALENADEESLKPAIEALRQAVYSNPKNISLVQMLAETLALTGEIDEAAEVIMTGVSQFRGRHLAGLLMALGDIYSEADRIDDAIGAYRSALEARGIRQGQLVEDSDRGFAILLVNKMVLALQRIGRINDAENVIESSRELFSDDDFVMDREKVSLMRATGRRYEALKLLQSLRQKAPDDYNLIRKEAELLTDLGKIDEAAGLILPLIEEKPEGITRSMKYDDFVNRLFIAGLYVRAGRSAEAEYHAQKAFEVAKGDQGKQLASLQIASASMIAGDYAAAEEKLKSILKQTPDNPMALNDLGHLYLTRGTRFREALGLIERAVSIDPRNPDYLDSLGLAHFKLGDLDKAERYLRRSLKYNISSVSAYELLGDVFLRKGKETEAHAYWMKALTVATSNNDVIRIREKIGQ